MQQDIIHQVWLPYPGHHNIPRLLLHRLAGVQPYAAVHLAELLWSGPSSNPNKLLFVQDVAYSYFKPNLRWDIEHCTNVTEDTYLVQVPGLIQEIWKYPFPAWCVEPPWWLDMAGQTIPCGSSWEDWPDLHWRLPKHLRCQWNGKLQVQILLHGIKNLYQHRLGWWKQVLKFKIISDNFFDLLQASIFWEYLQLQAKVIIIKHTKVKTSVLCMPACMRP